MATSKADYDKVGDEIHHLRDQNQKLLLESTNRDELKKRMADMSTCPETDEKVTVYEDKFSVEFKSGLTANVNE